MYHSGNVFVCRKVSSSLQVTSSGGKKTSLELGNYWNKRCLFFPFYSFISNTFSDKEKYYLKSI